MKRKGRSPRPAAARSADGSADGSTDGSADRQSLLLGVGFDGDDGHRRITRGRDVLIVGGSKDTHEQMQERAIRFNEELDRRGKRLAEVRCVDELREIAERAGFGR
jgi:hypothetical protein